MLYRKTYGWNYTLNFVHYSFWVVKFTLASRKFLLNYSQTFQLNRFGLTSVKLAALSSRVVQSKGILMLLTHWALKRTSFRCLWERELRHIYDDNMVPTKVCRFSHTRTLQWSHQRIQRKFGRPLRLGKWKTCECCRLLKTTLFWDVTMSSVVEIHWRFIESYRLVLENVKIQRVNQPLFRPITGL